MLFILTACDLQPPKPKAKTEQAAAAPAPPADATSIEPVPSPIPPGNTIDAGVGAPPKASEDCLKVAQHITKLVIESMTDPNAKAAQEADQAQMIKRIAEACTKDKWSATARTCFLNGKTAGDFEPCGNDLKAPE
jgi:hypothetical protein